MGLIQLNFHNHRQNHGIALGGFEQVAGQVVFDGGFDGGPVPESFTSINSHPLLGTQYFDIELDEANFLKEIAPARTIGFMSEIEQMRKMGMGLGGTLENALVYDDRQCLSVPRFPDELVRHKILMCWGTFRSLARGRGTLSPLNPDTYIIHSLLKKSSHTGRVNNGYSIGSN